MVCYKISMNKQCQGLDCSNTLTGLQKKWCSIRCRNSVARTKPGYKEYQKAYQAKWRKTPQGKASLEKGIAKYRKSDKGKTTLERARRRRQADGRALKSQRKYIASRRDKINAHNRERYHKKGGRGYRKAAKVLFAQDGPVCQICKGSLEQDAQGHWIYEVDHIVPKKHGGSDDLSNLQLSHQVCNARKNDTWDGTTPDEPPLQLSLFD